MFVLPRSQKIFLQNALGQTVFFHHLFLTALDSLKDFFNILERLNFYSLKSFRHGNFNIIVLTNKTLQFLINHLIVNTFADRLVLLYW